MNVELMKRMMDACYLAQRVRGMLPTLPEGVTPSYIHYLDIIEMLEKQGVRAKISDISDALDLPRPGVTRTVKAMEAKGYLRKTSSKEDGRITYITILCSLLLGLVMSKRIATALAICVAAIIYVFALFLLKAIRREEILMLPKGQKIAQTLEKHGWIG